jgi:hypothetical protein
MLRTACLCAVLALLPSLAAAQDAVAFQFDKATLEGKDVKLPVLRAHTPGRWLHATDDHRFLVKESTVTEVDRSTGKELWSVTHRESSKLLWKGAGKGIAHFLALSGKQPPGNDRTVVHRLDLNQRQWLPPLQFAPSNKDQANNPAEPLEQDQRHGNIHYTLDLLVDDGECVLLTYILDPERDQTYPSLEQRAILGHQVTCYRTGEDRPAWVRYFPWTGKKSLFCYSEFPNQQYYLAPAMRHLTWNADTMILVLAGSEQPLQSLDRSDGRLSWGIERLWEYERGMHIPKGGSYISRFGLPRLFFDPEEGQKQTAKAEKEARAAFEKESVAWISVGPIMIPSNQGRRIFVVTNSLTLRQRSRWPHHSQDNLRLYELTVYGDVLAQTSLPMDLLPDCFQATPEGISWACRWRGLVQVTPFAPQHEYSERRSSIRWYRELPVPRRKAWLTNGWVSEVGTFSTKYYILAHESGFFAAQDEPVYRLPISVIDLETCQERTFMMAIPYKGKMSLPKINVLSDGQTTRAIFGFMYLSVKKLQTDGDILRVSLVERGDHPLVTMEFDLSSLAPKQ